MYRCGEFLFKRKLLKSQSTRRFQNKQIAKRGPCLVYIVTPRSPSGRAKHVQPEWHGSGVKSDKTEGALWFLCFLDQPPDQEYILSIHNMHLYYRLIDINKLMSNWFIFRGGN